jgi:hypothetical protein
MKPSWLVLLLFAGVSACGPSDQGPPPPSSAVVFGEVDPEALVEGNVVALGVRLPAGSEITGEDPFGLQATVPYSLEKVSSYMRAHVEAKSVETGPQRTVFIDARHLGAGGKEPHLKIIVARHQFGTQLTFIKTPHGGTPSPYINPTAEMPAPPEPSDTVRPSQPPQGKPEGPEVP